jgi:hypothetical protein
MTAELDAWIELNREGRLLDRRALQALPEPVESTNVRYLSDRLRDAITTFHAVRGTRTTRRSVPPTQDTGTMSALLDVVLEEVCGFKDGWRKGRAGATADAETLLDGTVLRAYRVLTVAGETALAVFVTSTERVGMHKGKRIVAQVIEYLRRRRLPFGLVTNGREWRLVFAEADDLAWVEWVSDRWLDGDKLSQTLMLLRRVLSPASLMRAANTNGELGPSKLLQSIRKTRQGQTELSKELGERVRGCVELLLQARRPVLDSSWQETNGKSVYQAACQFVMRLVVILFAEARELLPIDNPIYHQSYGLRGLLESLERAGLHRRRARDSAWPRLLALFRLIHSGSYHPQLVVNTYGGELFRPRRPEAEGGGAFSNFPPSAVDRALGLLEDSSTAPDDETVYRMLVLLTRTTERVREGSKVRLVPAPVNFTELTSEYIGILYEGLLDYELHRVGGHPIVFLSLGDQPALPLDRLEAMSDKQLEALVRKANVKRTVTTDDESAEGDNEDDSDDPAEDEEPTADDEAQEDDATPLLDELSPDDDRARAMRRALAWAERAAIAGKLVKKPRGRKAADDPAWQAELARAAQAVIAREEIEPGKSRLMVKLPGELYLVRWGGTRKGAGTFYTRPQLTLPTVRRTLEPLLAGADGRVRPPEELLALKVCDPAMGSGSFLVAALRVLTEAIIWSLYEHGRIVRHPNAGKSDVVSIRCDLLPEADREQVGDRVEAIVRRAVVEHCLYGVDRDALAVELARVSLWVETLDGRLPFTFLDHKLRCGDALVGAWLDRFRDYPLLAWWRDSPDEGAKDKGWKGVHHAPNIWRKALQEGVDLVVDEQASLLGPAEWLRPVVSDDELRGAVDRVRNLYRRISQIAASRPDERARVWRQQIARDPALERVRHAFDTWCALWFWPLNRVADVPTPLTLHAPSDAANVIVAELRERKHFFHWELEFPDVFVAEGAGFDAVVANPPWEIQKPSSKEFFTDIDPLYRSYGKQDALARQRELFHADARVEERWLEYLSSFKDAGNFVRHAAEPFGDKEDKQGRQLVALAKRNDPVSRQKHTSWRAQRAKKTGFADREHAFCHQGSADLNSYKLFVEQAHALLRRGGQFGLITPSGLYTDKGAVDLRRLMLECCSWRWLYGFENRLPVFDIHRSFKFAVTIAEKGAKTETLNAAFMRHALEDWSDAKGALAYPAARIRVFSPKSLSVLEMRSERDLEVLMKIYENSVLLGDDSPDGWGIKYATEFHMTNDSKLFIPRDHAELAGYKPDPYGRWVNRKGDVLLPLYEGRMIGQFDFSKKGWVSGKGRTAVWRDLSWDNKRIEPQFLVRHSDFSAQHRDVFGYSRVAFMDVTASTNTRTMISVALPEFPCGNSAPILLTAKSSVAVAGIINSYAYDYVVRARCGGLHLNYFIVEETPLIKMDRHCDSLLVFGSALSWAPVLATLLMEGSRTDTMRAALTPHERLRVRCILDVLVAALYGLSRDDLRWILRECDHPMIRLSERYFCRALDPKGFWRVDKAEDPELRHTVLTLVAFDSLQKLIAVRNSDRDAAITDFLALNDGEGWMLPETLRLADYDLGHDERAQIHQPVAIRCGPRFLKWQSAQTHAERWAECVRHARAILGNDEFERRYGAPESPEVARPKGTPKKAMPSPPKPRGRQQKLSG